MIINLNKNIANKYIGSRSTPSFPCMVKLLKIKNCSINLKDFLYMKGSCIWSIWLFARTRFTSKKKIAKALSRTSEYQRRNQNSYLFSQKALS